MLGELQALSRLCTRSAPPPTTVDIDEGCRVVERVLGASDVYVIRAADPSFERVGCPCPPTDYEIKQKGYWLVWKRLASEPAACACLFDVEDRFVTERREAGPGVPATHLAMILPYNESTLDLLIARGPWPEGLTVEQFQFLESARPILALLLGNVLDADRRNRQREQLQALATLSDAFNRAQEGDDVLTAMATALARASGMDWVTILTYNESCTAIVDRGMNITRHWDTETAAVFKGPRSQFTDSELRVGMALAEQDTFIAIPNVFAEGLIDDPLVAPIRGDIPGLQRYWQRAHVLSMGIFPISVQGRPLGMVSFSSTTARSFDEKEVEFLRALVSQVAPAVRGIQLLRALHESREELRQSEERFRSLVQNASDLITVIDENTTVLYQSPSIHAVLGYEPQAIVGRQLIDLVHADDLEIARGALRRAAIKESPRVSGEIRVRHRNGSWLLVEFVGTDQRANPAIGGFVLNVRDVSERKALEQQLRHQALHDPLTRLLNRTAFVDRLHRALTAGRAGEQLAVLFMDLDNFKGVNDSLGHAAGDELLVQVAERLRGCLRPADTVARLGGDEFAILLEDIGTPEDAGRVAARVLDALDRPFCVEGKDLAVRSSVGIAIGGRGGAASNADTLLRFADVAMYTAKAAGKGRLEFFKHGMERSMLDRLELLADLQHAIEREEFVLHYQPMIKLDTGELYGLEALVRWQHPKRGMVPPGEFIPLAEESGAIVRLGRWVLREACRRAAAWQRAQPGTGGWTMSVNISARQLQHAHFVDDVASILGETGLQPGRLLLELTESAMMENLGVVAERLQALKTLGVRLALDDFGTGHSSLAYLRELPFDLLKIDRSFIADVGTVPPSRELARAIIELGNVLQIGLMAEGIERVEQVARLKALHCPMGQGFYFARPMDWDAVEALLEEIAGGRRIEVDAA